jgi:hypothetical protein
MNLNNPLEILLAVFLAVISVWLIERIIAGAFKTVIFGIIVVAVVLGYAKYCHHDTTEYNNPKYRFQVNDLVDSDSFKKKFDYYKKETIKDLKTDYKNVKKGE